MTEEEWLAATSPVALLHHLNADGYSRKVLLYAAAVCQRQPELLTPVLRDWLEVIEAASYGRATKADLERILSDTEFEACHLAHNGPDGTHAHYDAIADAVCQTWTLSAFEFAHEEPIPAEELAPVRNAHAHFVRDIFGNPFRPVAFDPAWRTDTAVSLARGMYDSRDFGAMPILADALQDAGCEDEQVLSHCRDTQQKHVRGCWVCDAVLGLS
jgi:hypothetical protein